MLYSNYICMFIQQPSKEQRAKVDYGDEFDDTDEAFLPSLTTKATGKGTKGRGGKLKSRRTTLDSDSDGDDDKVEGDDQENKGESPRKPRKKTTSRQQWSADDDALLGRLYPDYADTSSVYAVLAAEVAMQ